MTVEKSYDILVEQITIWCPIHDIVSNSSKWKKDAIEYFRGTYPTPFPPPAWLYEVFTAMNDSELEHLSSLRTNQAAYEYLIWYRHSLRSRSRKVPDRKQKPWKPQGRGRYVPGEEQEERLRLAPTMTAKEFAVHFNICVQAVYKWDEKNGYLIRKKRHADEDEERERTAVAPFLTMKEFANRFNISECAAWGWAKRHGLDFVPARRAR